MLRIKPVVIYFILSAIIVGSLSASLTIPILQQQQSFAQITKKVFNDSDFTTLYSSPDSHVGSNVNITGKIFNFPPSRTGEPKALQIYQAGNRDRNVVVFYKGIGPQLSENDCVRVIGTSAKQQQYANLFGATLTAAIINANSVDKIDCIYAINPAKKTVSVKETSERGGIMLFLNKIEFSDKNTRVYLSVSSDKNNNEDVHFYDSQSKAVQGNRQFGTTYSFDVDYPKIKSDILPGVTDYGVVLFEPLNSTENHAKFVFETSVGYSNNYRFIFDVNLNSNVNKEPEFSQYQNFDYKLRIACPTNWKKYASSNTSDFSLSCEPPEANFTNFTIIGLKAKANILSIPFPSPEQKQQYLSSVLSSLRNNTKLQIINSSYTTISNNSALQVFSLISSDGSKVKVKRLDTIINDYHYTIYYAANSEHFNKYLPIAQKVMDSLQITESKLPGLPQIPGFPRLPPLLPPEQNQSPSLGPIPELPRIPEFSPPL
jgi:hypothetical protein